MFIQESANDDLMARLQESFDATNCLAMRVKKIAQEILEHVMEIMNVLAHSAEPCEWAQGRGTTLLGCL